MKTKRILKVSGILLIVLISALAGISIYLYYTDPNQFKIVLSQYYPEIIEKTGKKEPYQLKKSLSEEELQTYYDEPIPLEQVNSQSVSRFVGFEAKIPKTLPTHHKLIDYELHAPIYREGGSVALIFKDNEENYYTIGQNHFPQGELPDLEKKLNDILINNGFGMNVKIGQYEGILTHAVKKETNFTRVIQWLDLNKKISYTVVARPKNAQTIPKDQELLELAEEIATRW